MLSDAIIQVFQNQGYALVSTLDKNGFVHNSCKGIVDIAKDGRVYLLDLYQGRTYENLKNNPTLSLTALQEHQFIGYCLKGKATIIPQEKLTADIIRAWEEKLASRLTKRLLKNIREEKGHSRHPEAGMPRPQYMIVVKVEEIVDLTPRHLKEGG